MKFVEKNLINFRKITGRFRPVIFLIFLVSISPSSFSTPPETGFPDSSYSNYTWQTFNQLPAANQKIDLFNPDYGLLNAAIFYAVNEQRESKKLPPYKFSAILRDAAVYHSDKMVEYKFFNDKNKKDTSYATHGKRVARFGGTFRITGENIARGTLMNYDDNKKYASFKQDPDYKYFFMNEKDEIQPTTYLAFAKKIVSQWLEIQAQKINMFYSPYDYLGCGVKESTVPYKERKLPAAVVTAVFGGYASE